MPEPKFLRQLEKVPWEKISIYRLATPRVDPATLRRTAEQFGIPTLARRGLTEQDNLKMTYRDGTLALTMFRSSGGLRFQDVSRFQTDDGKSRVEYDDKEAVSIATRTVRKLGLAPDGEYALKRITHLYVGGMDVKSGARDPDRAIDTGVYFVRQLGKIPFEGPGGMIVIYLDTKGKMSGVDQIWRKTELVYRKDGAVKAPATAREGFARFLAGFPAAVVEVQDMRLGYFEQGWNASQRYLQPAYVLPFTIETLEMHAAIRSVFVFEASVEPVGKLTPQRAIRPREPVRTE